MKQYSVIIISVCIALQLVQTLSSSHNNDLGMHVASDHVVQHLTRRARKLKLDDQASTRKGYVVQEKKDSFLGGKTHSKVEGEIRTHDSSIRRYWMEEGRDTSQYFTMDYSHVRRRRPIHNKSLPVAP